MTLNSLDNMQSNNKKKIYSLQARPDDNYISHRPACRQQSQQKKIANTLIKDLLAAGI